MMGRHVLGVMPVERGSLLFTVVDVAGHPELEGRSVHEAFREHSGGSWPSARPRRTPRRPHRTPSRGSGSGPASTGARRTGGSCMRGTASCSRRHGVAWDVLIDRGAAAPGGPAGMSVTPGRRP